MDPNATLKEALDLAGRISRRQEHLPDQAFLGEMLAELLLALDEWLRKGGFLPAQWAPDSLGGSMAAE